MSAEPGQDYLADGIVEAITAALSCIRSFFVIARGSAFTYKGRMKNARQLGKELGVAYLLEGSLQKAGNRLRIIVQLIETEGHMLTLGCTVEHYRAQATWVGDLTPAGPKGDNSRVIKSDITGLMRLGVTAEGVRLRRPLSLSGGR